MAAKSCRPIDTLVTADKLLEVIGDAKAPLSVSELARITGFSVDTVFRQMGTQEDLRWVERIGEGYVLGMRQSTILAKKRSQIQTKIEKAQQELAELTN